MSVTEIRSMRLLFGDEDLVRLLAGARSDDDDWNRATAHDRSSNVEHASGRNLWDEDFARSSMAQRREYRVTRVIEAEKKAGHRLVGDRKRSSGPCLFEEQRHDRTARRENVAVAHDDESSAGTVQVGANEDALLQGFGHTHDAHGLARLVRGHPDD